MNPIFLDRHTARLLDVALQWPTATLAWLAALTLVFALGLTRLELRTDGAAIHPDGNAIVERSEEDRRFFNEPDRVILLLTSRPDGPSVDSVAGLRQLKRLHESLRSLPGVESDKVRSLATVLDPGSDSDILAIKAFLDEIPSDADAHADHLRRIRHYPLATGLFLSKDGSAAAFYVPVAEGFDRGELVSALEAWVEARPAADFELRLSGPVTAEVMLGRVVLADLAWLVPIMVAVVAGLLFLSLGSVAGVVIPMAEVLLVLVWTLGAMGYCGVPITLVTTILPVVLMTMAVTDEIHLLERVQRHLSEGAVLPEGDAGRARLREVLEASLRDVGRPIVLTSLTTSIGFLSFVTASMAPIRQFGLFTALGILLAMLLTFSFVPALALRLPVTWFQERWRSGPPAPVLAHERFVLRRSGLAFALGTLLVLGSIPGLFRLSVQDSWIENFDPDSAVVSAERDFNAKLWGSYRLDVVMHRDDESDARFFQRAPGLKLMEELRRVALAGPHVGGFASHLEPFEIVAEALGESVPVSEQPRQTIMREVVFVRAVLERIDLDHYIDWGATHARAQIFVNSPNYARSVELRDYLELEIPLLLAERGVSYHLSGDLAVAIEVVRAIVFNQLRSVGWTLVGIGLLLWLILGSWRPAATLMLPVVAALPVLLGAMGYAGLPLGIATTMFTALTIGVGVDFALHFSHAYRRERLAGRGHDEALSETLSSTGRAIRWNAIVLSLGFLVLTLSSLKPNHALGLLLASAMLTCYATTLLFLPRLLRQTVSAEAPSAHSL